jgi:hypothetical protein
VRADPKLCVEGCGSAELFSLPLGEIVRAWRGHLAEGGAA